jgi:SAM-dependent methyltransferase
VDHLLRATAAAEARHFWFRGFRFFVGPLLREATKGISAATLLDCGCGTGANVEWLNGFGRAYGFDLSPVGLRIGLASGRRRLAQATVAAVPFPGNVFDVVTSFDVIYSLETAEERAAVAEMYRVVKPGGFVIINVAAMESLRGDHSVLSREIRRYSRASLRKLLVDAGFSIVRLTYTNAVLFLPMFASRAVQRRRGLSAEDANATGEITVPAAPVNALLTAALAVESVWLRVFDSPFGSSLLCLARKPAVPAIRSGSPKSFAPPTTAPPTG